MSDCFEVFVVVMVCGHRSLVVWWHLVFYVSYQRDADLSSVVASQDVADESCFDGHLDLVGSASLVSMCIKCAIPSQEHLAARHTVY